MVRDVWLGWIHVACTDVLLKLATQHSKVLETIVDAFESFDRCLPRFYHYLRRYGSKNLTVNLKKSLVQFYAELIGFCLDTVQFLNVTPLSECVLFYVTMYHYILLTRTVENLLLFSHPARLFSRDLEKRYQRLGTLTEWVDLEVIVAEQDQQSQHRELWNMRIAIYTTTLLSFGLRPKRN